MLEVIEFTSTRKRMSVIVRTPAGKLLLMVKGAVSGRLRFKRFIAIFGVHLTSVWPILRFWFDWGKFDAKFEQYQIFYFLFYTVVHNKLS